MGALQIRGKRPSSDPVLGQLAEVGLFSACSPQDLATLRQVTDIVSVPAGDVIVAQGDRLDWFYAIVSGTAVLEHDGRAVEHLGPGAYFGEVAVLRRQPASFSVVCTSPVELLVIGRREFLGAVDRIRPLSAALLRALARRAPEFDPGPGPHSLPAARLAGEGPVRLLA